jgi:hypothetical protein
MAQLTAVKDMSVFFAMGTLLTGMYLMQGNTRASVAVIDVDRAIT